MLNEKILTTFKTFEYTYFDEQDIHVMTFLVSSRECIDEFMIFMEHFHDGLTDNDEIRFLIDYRRSGMPPIAYALRKTVSWANDLSTQPKVHVAFVHKGDFVVGLFGSLLNSLRFGHLRAQFFEGAEGYDKGIAWLESEQF